MSTRQALSNARWTGLSQASRLLVQLASIAVLSRLLSPNDFGIMAMAAIVSNLALLFRDLGTAAALIQRREVTAELIDTVFVLNVAFGCVVGICVLAAAPVAAHLFHTAALTGVIMTLAITFPVSAFGASQLALMERESRFRDIAWIEIVSACVGLVIAIGAAVCGLGVYSFVVQSVATAIISAGQIWMRSSQRPKLRWSRESAKSIWHFSGNFTVFNLVNYFTRNTDSMLVGRFLGSYSLGCYNVAYRILLFPLQNFTVVTNRALLPVYARLQDDAAALRGMYLRTLTLIASITGPLMLGLWALRREFVIVAFGPKWMLVAEILAWFAPMGFLQSLLSTSGTLLSAIGRTDVMRTLGIVNCIALIGAFLLGLRFGLMGIVVCYGCMTLLITATSLHVTLKQVASNVRALLGYVWKLTACAMVMAVVLLALASSLRSLIPSSAILIVEVPLGAAVYIGLLMLFSPSTLMDLQKIVWHRRVSFSR